MEYFQVAAISEESSECASENASGYTATTSYVQRWKSFDMRSVVSATEDLFHFILSEKGWRIRVFLIQDIIKAADAFLQETSFPCIFDEEEASKISDSEVC